MQVTILGTISTSGIHLQNLHLNFYSSSGLKICGMCIADGVNLDGFLKVDFLINKIMDNSKTVKTAIKVILILLSLGVVLTFLGVV